MKKDRRKKHGILYILLLVCLIGLFCLSAYKVTTQLLTERKERQAFDSLAAQIVVTRPTRPVQSAPSPTPENSAAAPEITQEPAPTAPDHPQDSAAPQDQPTAAPPEISTEPGAAESEAPTGRDVTPTPEPTASPEPTATPEPTPKPTPTEVPPMLEAYEPLYRQNKHLFGWLTIEGTDVNLPVMHTPWNSEYYLHRTFSRTDSFSGVPFMEGSCYPGCGNYIIYGHHMKNGTMFAPIVNYAEEKFWEEHQLIYFDTLYEYGTYEVVAAFYSRVYAADETGVFHYYRYTDLTDPEVFDEYMAQVMEAAIYETGAEAAYGDQLITLSTCEYSVENGRFVVVARKID